MRDYCKDCPAAWSSCDYWGEWDEGCELNIKYYFSGKGCKLICRLPKFIKKLYLKFYRWKEDRRWERYERKHQGEG